MGVVKAGHGLDDAGVHIGKRGFHRIASLQDADIRSKLLIEPGIAISRETHVGQGIGVVVVLAG